MEEKIDDYRSFVSDNLELKGSKKLAIIASSPSQIAGSIIYSSIKKNTSLKYHVFSTIEAALSWLNIDLSNIEIIESEIEKNEI